MQVKLSFLLCIHSKILHFFKENAYDLSSGGDDWIFIYIFNKVLS